MTRKMAWVGFSYMFGLFLAAVSGTAFSFAAAGAFGLTAAAMIILMRTKKIKGSVRVAVCLICAAAGAAYYSAYDILVYEKAAALDGRKAVFNGRIISSDAVGKGKTAYTVKGRLNGKIPAGIILYSDDINARTGDKISFSSKMYVFRDSYTFRAVGYYKAAGIYLRCYSAEGCITEKNDISFRRAAENYKNRIIGVIYKYAPEKESAMLTAMLLGDKSDIDNNMKTVLYRSGCGHIMAVSGIHMTVIYVFLTGIMTNILFIEKRISFGISMVILLFFCVMAGLSPSAVRAYIMLFVYGLGELSGRRGDTLNSLGIAGIIITLPSPAAVWDGGLLMSFAGVIGTGAAGREAIKKAEKIYRKGHFVDVNRLPVFYKTLISAFCTYAVTFPVSMMIFDEVSVISPLSDLILVPFCETALILTAAAALTGGTAATASTFIGAAAVFCKPVLVISEYISKIPVLYIPLGNTAVKCIAAALTAMLFCMAVMGKDILRSCTISMAAIVFAVVSFNLYRGFSPSETGTAYVFGNGGGAAVVRNGKRAFVIDIDGGAAAADKYLRQNGIYCVDAVILPVYSASAVSSYNKSFGLYKIGEYILPENRLDTYGDNIYCFKNSEGFDFGYAYVTLNGGNGISVSADGKIFLIPFSDISDSPAYCVFAGNGGKYTVSGSEYIITAGAECFSEDGIIYENVCMEFTEKGRRRLFNGGNNRKSAEGGA